MDWVAMIFSVIGIILNAKKNMWCWIFWISSNLCWLIYFLGKSEYPVIILNIVFIIVNVYGWREWSKANGSNIITRNDRSEVY